MIQSTQKTRTVGTRFQTVSQFQALSGKTMIKRAAAMVPAFQDHLQKFEQQVTLGSYSQSTLFNYARSVAGLVLYFGKSPLDLDDEEINSYIYGIRLQDTKSQTYFKHLVYGLRFFFRMYDREVRALKLPSIKEPRRLPVVLSRQELKRLFVAPSRQKQRVMFCLIYAAGLRISELSNLRISDIDFDRKQIRIQHSKGNKDRYVILSDYIARGITKHIQGAKPRVWLFNGRKKGTPISHSAVQQSFRLAVKKAGILKDVSVHSLRHSFATHMLEDGVDIVTIKEQLGHADLRATMLYLHVAKIPRTDLRSPLDTLYEDAL
jgi:integrase/recombinase XerD